MNLLGENRKLVNVLLWRSEQLNPMNYLFISCICLFYIHISRPGFATTTTTPHQLENPAFRNFFLRKRIWLGSLFSVQSKRTCSSRSTISFLPVPASSSLQDSSKAISASYFISKKSGRTGLCSSSIGFSTVIHLSPTCTNIAWYFYV